MPATCAGRAARCRWRPRGRGAQPARGRRRVEAVVEDVAAEPPQRRVQRQLVGVSSSSTGPSKSTARRPARRSTSQARARARAAGARRRDPESGRSCAGARAARAVRRTQQEVLAARLDPSPSAGPASRSSRSAAVRRGGGAACSSGTPTNGAAVARCADRVALGHPLLRSSPARVTKRCLAPSGQDSVRGRAGPRRCRAHVAIALRDEIRAPAHECVRCRPIGARHL